MCDVLRARLARQIPKTVFYALHLALHHSNQVCYIHLYGVGGTLLCSIGVICTLLLRHTSGVLYNWCAYATCRCAITTSILRVQHAQYDSVDHQSVNL